MSHQKQKTRLLALIWEFVKLQIAGNVLFFGTLIGFFVGENILHTPILPTLIVASILANILFFMLNRDWVFTGTNKGKNDGKQTAMRFTLFMGLNFVLNIVLIELFATLLRQAPSAPITAGLFTLWSGATDWLSPVLGSLEQNWQHYVAQFLSGIVFAAWSFIGLRFWVFSSPWHHAQTSHHQAITVQPLRKRHPRS